MNQLLIKVLLTLPILGKKIRNSEGFLYGQVHTLYNNKNYEKSLQLAIKGLISHGASSTLSYDLLKYAILSVANIKKREFYDDVKEIVLSNFATTTGREYAESVIKLSLLGHFFDDRVGMIELAKIASSMDETWGEADFLLGWYDLKDSHSIEYFRSAISKNIAYKERILNDPNCKKYPDILNALE